MGLVETFSPRTVEISKNFSCIVEGVLDAPLMGRSLDAVQVNIGLKCNLACRHCHVESSPKRGEEMTWNTMQDVLRAAQSAGAHTLDITGGAPEMHPRFRDFVDAALLQGLRVTVRTNLTIMLQPGYEEFPTFFADRAIHLVASLPCHLPNNVDKQRGRHVYRDSIAVIQQLNKLGYGKEAGKILDLVYNPGGPNLSPDERALEEAYRRALQDEFGIQFNRLYTITNMPIGRFMRDLSRTGRGAAYRKLLRQSFNPETLDDLMCRHQLHVGWDGTMYDCDFNFALQLHAAEGAKVHDFNPEIYRERRIATGEHCFACTAGCGSSCGGALT